MSEGHAPLERVRRANRWRFMLLGALALLGIAVLGALIVLQQQTDGERDRALARQQHSFDVILRASQLSAAISGAEAALGRYVVSGDMSLGRQYQDRWSQASAELARLRQLTGDNPEQQARVGQLLRAYEVRGKELGDTALYSSFKRHKDAWGAYYEVRASPAREQVETLLSRIADAERIVLRDRSAAATRLVENSTYAARILSVFGVLIVLGAVLLGWLAIEAQGERAVADADARAERERAAELQLAVAEATAQLRAEVNERIAAEEQLRQAQKMEAVGQLTGGIAHDFNNMLAVVLGGLELARRHLARGGEDARRHLEHAMEGANRAAALTRRLLAFARSEPLLPEAVAPVPLIAGMSELLDRTLGDGIAVETRGGTARWRVWVDGHQLENALLNLAVNARDAMDGRGRLTISADDVTLAAGEVGECAAGDYVAIAVADTGCGMTPEVLERVYEPFFTTKPVGKGTGLGLSQIFGFVRQSDGEIAIRSAPGRGTVVTLYLPRHIGEVDAGPAETPPAIEPAAAGSYDILVVEDDPRVLAATVGALEELGHRVRSCGDPLRAAEEAAAMPALDLILSDVLMPGRTGPEMVAGLGGVADGVAVLFVTGYTGDAEAEMFGGRPVLRKPFTMARLARAVEEAVAFEARRDAAAAAAE